MSSFIVCGAPVKGSSPALRHLLSCFSFFLFQVSEEIGQDIDLGEAGRADSGQAGECGLVIGPLLSYYAVSAAMINTGRPQYPFLSPTNKRAFTKRYHCLVFMAGGGKPRQDKGGGTISRSKNHNARMDTQHNQFVTFFTHLFSLTRGIYGPQILGYSCQPSKRGEILRKVSLARKQSRTCSALTCL